MRLHKDSIGESAEEKMARTGTCTHGDISEDIVSGETGKGRIMIIDTMVSEFMLSSKIK